MGTNGKTVKMVGGCSYTEGGLIPKWTLVADKCRESGVCRCAGQTSKLLLHGDYPGFGKRV